MTDSAVVRTGSILDQITAERALDLAADQARRPLAEVRRAAESAPPARDFAAAIRARPIGLIAEIKRASPSKGELAADVDPADLAGRYASGGADAISVLTEPHRFRGSLADLTVARAAAGVPVLRKDFLFDPYHLYEARAAGADAALLIVAMLEQRALADLIILATDLGIAALVEVHLESEVERALEAGARIVGINNRDLHTFQVDLAVTERVRPLVPADRTVVGESGVFDASHVARLAAAGVDAILIGESLMRAGPARVGDKIAELKLGATAVVR